MLLKGVIRYLVFSLWYQHLLSMEIKRLALHVWLQKLILGYISLSLVDLPTRNCILFNDKFYQS